MTFMNLTCSQWYSDKKDEHVDTKHIQYQFITKVERSQSQRKNDQILKKLSTQSVWDQNMKHNGSALVVNENLRRVYHGLRCNRRGSMFECL